MVTSGASSGTMSVARCGDGSAAEEMGEAQLPAVEGGGGPPVVTALVAAPRPNGGGGVLAVVGCDTGELFLIECVSRGHVTVTAMDRSPGAGGGGAGTPETPSKWGMFSSVAKAGLRYLRDASDGDAGGAGGAVKSLAWMPASASSELRLLALTATALDEWEVGGSPASAALVGPEAQCSPRHHTQIHVIGRNLKTHL